MSDSDNLRVDLIPVVDAGRQLVSDLGFRQRRVYLRTRTWDDGRVGKGGHTDADTELLPRPKVSEPPAKLIHDAPGLFEAGDIIVSKISATLDEQDINPLASAGVEVIWVVEDAVGGRLREYKMVGAPKNLAFGFTVQLRRMNRRPTDP